MHDQPEGTDQGTDSEVDMPEPAKQTDESNVMSVLKDIQNKVANLTIQKEKTERDISQINQSLTDISLNMVSKQELNAAIGGVTDTYLKDKDKLDQTLQEFTTRLDLVGTEFKETSQVQNEKMRNLELSINDTKLVQIVDLERMKEKIHQLETEVKDLKEAKKTNLAEKGEKGQKEQHQDSRKSLIMEGLTECPQEDIYDVVINTIRQIGMNIFENDIDLAYRIGKFRGFDTWPRPVRVLLVSERVKLHIMENREEIKLSQTHYNVRFLKDEPKEKRVARAILRKGAIRARERGSHVTERAEGIQINGKFYNLENAHELERSYKDALMSTTAPKVKTKMNTDTDKGRSRKKIPCERETEKWYAFYTKESIYSSFYNVPVTYRGVPYQTLEHGYQATHALECNDMEAYRDILKAETPAEAKDIGGRIPFSEHWEKIKGPHMEELQYAKFTQHPYLADKLCKTIGKLMIEGSKDRYWGAGVTVDSPILDTQRFGGRNELGKRIGNARIRILADRKGIQSPAPRLEMAMETSASLGQQTPGPPIAHLTGQNPMTLSPLVSADLPTGETQKLPANTAIISDSIEILEVDISPNKTTKPPPPPLSPKVYYKEGVIEV